MIEDGTRVCGKHERLTLISKLFPSDRLTNGRFMKLTRQGLPMERAEFFIDPWSTAYWMRATCNEERDKIFLYSFGPNRRRDSSRWKRRGDGHRRDLPDPKRRAAAGRHGPHRIGRALINRTIGKISRLSSINLHIYCKTWKVRGK